jgi:hypothetical protein
VDNVFQVLNAEIELGGDNEHIVSALHDTGDLTRRLLLIGHGKACWYKLVTMMTGKLFIELRRRIQRAGKETACRMDEARESGRCHTTMT